MAVFSSSLKYNLATGAVISGLNVNSLLDYLIIDQIMGEQDHVWKSFNMYYVSANSTVGTEYEKGKLNFGPIWDYDWALYTEWTGEPNVDYTITEDEMLYSNIFLALLICFSLSVPISPAPCKNKTTGYFFEAL